MERTKGLELRTELPIQAPRLTNQMILGRLLDPFEHHFPYVENGVNITF